MATKYYTNTYSAQNGSTGRADAVDEEFDDIEAGLTSATNEATPRLVPSGANSLVLPNQAARNGNYLTFDGNLDPAVVAPSVLWPTGVTFLGTLGLRLASDVVNVEADADLAWTRVDSNNSPFYVFPETVEPNEIITCMAGVYTFMINFQMDVDTFPVAGDLEYLRDTGGGLLVQDSRTIELATGGIDKQPICWTIQETQVANFDIKFRINFSSTGDIKVLLGHLWCMRWNG